MSVTFSVPPSRGQQMCALVGKSAAVFLHLAASKRSHVVKLSRPGNRTLTTSLRNNCSYTITNCAEPQPRALRRTHY